MEYSREVVEGRLRWVTVVRGVSVEGRTRRQALSEAAAFERGWQAMEQALRDLPETMRRAGEAVGRMATEGMSRMAEALRGIAERLKANEERD